MYQFHFSIGRLSATQQGIYVSCILLSSSLSSLASGHISDRLSRKYGILIGSILFLIGTIISACSPNFVSLIFARLVTGIGMGQAISVTTVYLVEIAPADVRGVVACSLQLYVVIGIMSGYFIAYGTQHVTSSLAWRLPFVIQAVIAAVLSSGIAFMPFSPRWLVQVDRSEDARQVLAKLRPAPVVDTELEEIQESLHSGGQQSTASFAEIFSKRYIGRTALGVFIMAFQQLTGVSSNSSNFVHCREVSETDSLRSTLFCTTHLVFSNRPVSHPQRLHFCRLV